MKKKSWAFVVTMTIFGGAIFRTALSEDLIPEVEGAIDAYCSQYSDPVLNAICHVDQWEDVNEELTNTTIPNLYAWLMYNCYGAPNTGHPDCPANFQLYADYIALQQYAESRLS